MCARPDGPFWQKEGADWPHREASRFVEAAGLVWHVQQMGQGPVLLLVHGTGASSHTWRASLHHLARHFTVVAPDLPGQGFSGMPRSIRLSLPGMASSLGTLLETLSVRPDIVVGHSAGAAILTQMVLDGTIAPRALVSLNGAFVPFEGAAGLIFPPLAKLLFLNPFVPRFVAWGVGDGSGAERLIRDTGSTIDKEGMALYTRLFRSPGHVAGTLGMMANWDVRPMFARLDRLSCPLVLVVGDRDRVVMPRDANAVRTRVPHARIVSLPGLGHLAHEEDPEALVRIVREVAGHGLPALEGGRLDPEDRQ